MTSTSGIYGVLAEWVKVLSLIRKVACWLSRYRSTSLDEKKIVVSTIV